MGFCTKAGFPFSSRVSCWGLSLFIVISLFTVGSSRAANDPGAKISPEETAQVNAQLAAVEDYIFQSPDSPEVPVLRSQLGTFYRTTGRFSKAMQEWGEAFKLARDRQDERGWHAADNALANHARLLASLGRLDDLLTLIKENADRQMINPDAANIWMRTLHAAVRMRQNPRASYKCGVYALANVAQRLLGADFKTVAALGSPETGFSLANLEEFARKNAIPVRAAARTMGDYLPVPSVVHWAQNHYAAIVNRQGDYYTVVDPTFGGVQYLSADAINEEASGYFLIRQDELAPGYRWVDATEAGQVFGKGFPDASSDDDPDTCQTPCCINSGSGADGTGGECQSNDSENSNPGSSESGTGMAVWSVVEPAINLRLTDIPLSYTPAYGPSFVMRVNWQQRAVPGWWGVLGRNSNLGFAAGSSQVNFICGPATGYIPVVARTSLSETELSLWILGAQRVRLAFPVDVTDSVKDPTTGIWARRIMDEGGNLVAIEVYYRNGSMERYEPDPTFWIMNLRIRKDSNGNALTYDYTPTTVRLDDTTVNVNRVNTVTTADGKVFTFNYAYNEDVYSRMLITGVSGPDGRSISFGYTFVATYAYLTSITDAVGITSSVSGNSTYPFAITQLTTPYGDTQFSHYSQSGCIGGGNLSCDGIDRSIVITEPDGSHQVYLFYDELLDTPFGIPSAFGSDQIPDYWAGNPPPVQTLDTIRNKRNSHHWNGQQAAAISTSPINPANFVPQDFRISTTKHWLVHWLGDGIPGTMSRILSWELPPSPDGITEALPLFYDYPGKDPTHLDTVHNVPPNAYVGSSPFPAVMAQRKPDGTTWYESTPRNSAGMMTSKKHRWEEGGAVKSRTWSYTYATGTGDDTVDNLLLVEEKGPSNELIRGYKLHPTYKGLYIEATNAVGEVTLMGYNAVRQLTSRQTPAGLLTTFTYDTESRVQTEIDSVSGTPVRTNSFTWLNGFKRTHTDPRGLTRTYDYDFLGRITQVTYSSDSTTEQFFYALPANTGFNTAVTPLPVLDLVTRKDRMGQYWYSLPNRLRQLEKSIEPPRAAGQTGVEHSFSYCGCGSPTSITRASNKTEAETTSYVYDYRGNPITLNLPDSVTITREYDRLGRLYKEIDSYSLTTNTYDNLDRLREVRNGKGLVSALGYDVRNRIMGTTNASGIWSTNAYDALSRVLIRGYADSTSGTGDGKELWGYTAGYQEATSYTNQIGVVTTWKYDPSQFRTNEVVTGVYTNKYLFYPAGEIYQLKDGKDQLTSWNYDKEGRIWKKLDANNTEILRYTNNANGWLLARWSKQKGTTYYSYDLVGNRTAVSYPSTPPLSLTYNALNRLTSEVNYGGVTVNYTYRPGGLTESETVAGWANSTVTYGYTTRLRTSLTLQQPVIGNWSQSYTYDSAKRLNTVVSPPGTYTYVYPVDTTAYKASRQVTRISLPNTSFITNTFDAVGRQLSTLLKNSAGTVLNGHTYLVNKAAQRTKQTRTDGSYVNYSYDNASELREGLTFTSGNVAVSAENFAFGYDTAQSMKARTNNATVSTYTINALNQVTADGSYTYSYDLNGNRTGKLQTGSVFYTYDDENQLTSAATDTTSWPVASRWKTEWTYDTQGRMRTRKEYSHNGTTWVLSTETRYLYDGRRVIQERNGSNVPLVTYVRGLDLSGTFEEAGGIGGLLSRTAHSGANGATLTHAFYHADANGNITKLIDGSQSSVADYKYDPFGRTISSSGTLATANVYRFSSKELMAQCGFYYYGFRFYDPLTQRWVNRDPIQEEGGINLYRFAGNGPIDRLDPDGRFLANLGAAAFGGAVDLALQLAMNGGRFDCVSWSSVGISALATGAGYGLGATAAKLGQLGRAARVFDKAARKVGPLTNYWKAEVAAANAARRSAAAAAAGFGAAQVAKHVAKGLERGTEDTPEPGNGQGTNGKGACP